MWIHRSSGRMQRPLSCAILLFALLVVAWWQPGDTEAATSHADRAPGYTVPTYALYLPTVRGEHGGAAQVPLQPGCPTTSSANYAVIPIEGSPADHPDVLHGDLNLALRGYAPAVADLELINISGGVDPNAPQLPGLFTDTRVPQFSAGYRIYDWDWACGPDGCRSTSLVPGEVTLLGMAVSPGEPIRSPSRNPEIYSGGFTTLVLYAEKIRITLGYTRQDSVAPGYAVHLEGICVDPNLLDLYRERNSAGRSSLPALHNGEPLGTAQGDQMLVAIRDRGTFMDPRSRKDWWQGR